MKARRSNGDGAIDKLKRKRKDGTIVERWRGRVRLGVDPRTGCQRRVTLYAETRSELATKIARLKTDADRGIVPSSERITVEAFMRRWLDDVMAARVRLTTLALYRDLNRVHIENAAGARRLDKQTAQDVQAILSAMHQAGRSERLRAMVLTLLRSALDQAVRWELVPRNVARLVDKPCSDSRKMVTLDRDQVARFLEAAKPTPFAALYTLALTLGLRRGELLGLQWRDVDFEKGTVSIVRSVVNLRGKPHVAETKTDSSRRLVDLPAVAVRALREQQVRLFARKLRASPWVFPNEDGGPMSPRNLIRRSFVPILESAQRKLDEEAANASRYPEQFPRIRFHDLRHTAATIMLAIGIQPKVVQERLGHSSIAVTMDTYSHVMPSMQREACDRLDALFSSLGA
jgi:integrase